MHVSFILIAGLMSCTTAQTPASPTSQANYSNLDIPLSTSTNLAALISSIAGQLSITSVSSIASQSASRTPSITGSFATSTLTSSTSTTSQLSATSSSISDSQNNVAIQAIAGAAIGATAGIILLATLAGRMMMLRRRRIAIERKVKSESGSDGMVGDAVIVRRPDERQLMRKESKGKGIQRDVMMTDRHSRTEGDAGPSTWQYGRR